MSDPLRLKNITAAYNGVTKAAATLGAEIAKVKATPKVAAALEAFQSRFKALDKAVNAPVAPALDPVAPVYPK